MSFNDSIRLFSAVTLRRRELIRGDYYHRHCGIERYDALGLLCPPIREFVGPFAEVFEESPEVRAYLRVLRLTFNEASDLTIHNDKRFPTNRARFEGVYAYMKARQNDR